MARVWVADDEPARPAPDPRPVPPPDGDAAGPPVRDTEDPQDRP
ncbi:hypothetical protein [Pseudonocardia spirodelae]|uniref:Uncharacterized protein n=1 Tax=Pseudonocardia spirodelae TaxID=3133431 RepID=A0ABU8T384_9PSEU